MSFHGSHATFVTSLQLKVENLTKSIQFYRDTLGFKILEQDERTAKLTADGKTTILTLVQPANVIPKQGRTTGLFHFALLLPDRSDLALLVIHLAKKDIKFGASDHLVSEAIYFDDPDGNGIEIYADTAPSTWQWTEKYVAMDTIPLDFDDLLASVSHLKDTWSGMPRPTIIGHIHLHVSELQAAETFYTKGLGFEIVSRFRDSAIFLSTDKYHHHIALNTWNGVGAPKPPRNSAGLDFFTLVFPNRERLEQAIADLEKIGATVGKANGKIAIEDPAGNAILLIVEGENL